MNPGTFRYVASHPDNLASGANVAFGDQVDLDAEALQQPQNARLVSSGALVQLSQVPEEAGDPPAETGEPERKPARRRPRTQATAEGEGDTTSEEESS